jgi:lysozyme family protein
MSESTFDAVASWLLAHEGGFVNHPKDPGGATNMGITIGTLSAWRGNRVTVEAVRDLTKDEALRIYRRQYWDAVRADDLPAGLDYAMFDYAVNSGPARAVKELQRIVGVKADGVVGAMTLDAVVRYVPGTSELIRRLCDARLAFMRRLKGWATFGKGWQRRVDDVRIRSLKLAGKITTTVTAEPKPAPDKAKGQDAKAVDAWATPQGAATGITAISGLSGMLTGDGPVQWALAVVFVIAALGAGYYLVRRFRDDND